jgi:fluoroquinolone transport system permease protein
MFRQIFKSDLKSIIRDPILVIAVMVPVMLILLLKFAFPLISDFIYSENGFRLDDYYSIIAITIVAVIPILVGFVYAFLLIGKHNEKNDLIFPITPSVKNNFSVFRIIFPSVLTFLLVSVSIIIVDPVPEEGCLRTIFVSAILSAQTPFTMLFIGGLSGNRFAGFAISKLYGIFLVVIPFGLLVHHPWNHFAFFSPFYWISWAWIVSSPAESLLYAAIALILTLCGTIVLFCHFLRNHRN